MSILLWIGTVLVTLAIWLNSPDGFWRYIFFLRVPILIGLLLIFLPLIATRVLRAMLRNLFVLRGRWQLAFVIISALIAGTAVVLVANIILNNAPARFGVVQWLTIPEFWQYVLAIALGMPVCITAIILSKEQSDQIGDRDRWMGVLTGGVFSLGLLFAFSFTRKWLASNTELKQLVLKAISFFTKQETGGYINPKTGELASGHLTAFAFFLVAVVVYGLIALRFKPKPKSRKSEAPALLYLMLIITVTTLLVGGMTFFFDFYRVLPLVMFLVVSAASYALFDIDHFFELKPLKDKKPDPQLKNFGAVLEKRLQHQSGERTLVIVCASGGGIQAAAWTVQVLTGLQKLLGESFTQAIGFISSASGGSVGTMYYLDRFNLQKHAPDEEEFEAIFRSATQDSLDAIGWGLAYPDLWRLIGLPFLAPKLCDRGKAVETDWQGELKNPQSITSIATWRNQVLEGEIPVPVFNATVVDDGRRFLISPMTFGRANDDKFVDFNTLYGEYDMSVVTAARLSATFPYISPVCRPYVSPVRRSNINLKGKNYHIADGGYFDNSGVFTVVEWLDKWLASDPKPNPNIKKVILLQINAFPKASSQFQDTGKRGWFMAFIGPLLTLFKVRDSTQTARNMEEVEILQQRWKDSVEIKHFPIFFPSFEEMCKMEEDLPDQLKRPSERPYFFNKGKYEPPLSWKLTDGEKKAIKDAWKMLANDPNPESIVQKIKKQWMAWGMG